MIPKPSEALLGLVRQGLQNPAAVRRATASTLWRTLRPVVPDLARFNAQSDEFRSRWRKQVAAKFRDDTEKGAVEVLLAPDLLDFEQSYDALTEVMRNSGIATEAVDESRAEEIFVDRVAEFLTAYSARGSSGGGGSSSANTIVHTNRHGDSVLYCLGYFVSTATAFGISTPASIKLKGRYSFGIVDSGVQKFDGIVWTCPAVVGVDLP
jgi:hypothetical protein